MPQYLTMKQEHIQGGMLVSNAGVRLALDNIQQHTEPLAIAIAIG